MSTVAGAKPGARTTLASGREAAVVADARRRSSPWRVAPYLALGLIVAAYLALTIARRYVVVADELAAFGAGMRIYYWGPFTPNLVEQLVVNPYLIAALAKPLGPERAFVAARWAQAVFGLLTLLGTWDLARRLTGRAWPATWAAALLVAAPFFTYSHHFLRMDNPETTGFVLTLLALAAWMARPSRRRLALVGLAAAGLVAGKLLGLLFLPGLLGVALAWRLRGKGGLPLAISLIAAIWLAWVLPQILILRIGLTPDQAQGLAILIAAGLALLVLIGFRFAVADLIRSPRLLLIGCLAIALFAAALLSTSAGRDRYSAYQQLINYQLQRFTIALDENHPGNQERFPEGYIWYLSRWVNGGLDPETVALAAVGIGVVLAERRRPAAARIVRFPGGPLLLLLPLLAGYAFLGGARSWFLRYSLPLFPIFAILAAVGTWAIAAEIDAARRWLQRRGGRLGRIALPVATPILVGAFALGLLARNVDGIIAQNRDGEERAAFFALRETFGQKVLGKEIILADHGDSWIYDSGLFLEPRGAYPLMMLGVPVDAQMENVRWRGLINADWVLTDHPITWPAYDLVFSVNKSAARFHFDEAVAAYFVYRNRYSVEPGEDVRIGMRELLNAADVIGGNDPGLLVHWNFDGRRHEAVGSHPGDGVPNRIKVPLMVESGDRLRGSYGYNPDAAGLPSDGATVAIKVIAGGEEKVLLSDESVEPPPMTEECGPWNVDRTTCTPQTALPRINWTSFDIDLAPFAGQPVTLIFETGPGPAGQSAFDWTGWADLRIARGG